MRMLFRNYCSYELCPRGRVDALTLGVVNNWLTYWLVVAGFGDKSLCQLMLKYLNKS